MNPITAICNVHNEEKYIEESFNLLKPYVDDFVVIDQGSTDKTVEIAKQFTDKVYLFPQAFYSYAYIHQAALVAKHEWVVKIDPDERYDKCLLDSFGELIKQDYDVIKFRMVYWGDDKSINPRLWRKNKVIWTDSLDARIYNEEDLKVFEVPEGVITNLRNYKDSINRYRLEASKRFLVKYGETKVPFYVEMCKYYKQIIEEAESEKLG